MKVVGFTFVRNGVKYGYPFRQSILSLLPLVDEMVVNLGDGRSWYPSEIRVIKNDKKIRSYRDAQGFRWQDGRKLNVKLINAHIYHYGWVINPVVMNRKQTDFASLCNGKSWTDKKYIAFDYSKIDSLALFEGTHPSIMTDIVTKEDWEIGRNINKKKI